MKDVPFGQITDSELVELIQRRSPHHPRRISRREMRAFLDGRLTLRGEAGLGENGGVFISTEALVEAMIRAGIHTVTNNGEGMSAARYRQLWPHEVLQPAAYVGRFDKVLLVDTTVPLADLVERGNVEVDSDPASCEDTVPPPSKDGVPLTRYVAFFQDGTKNEGRSMEDCFISFAMDATDEVGLVTREGLYLTFQHEPILHDHGVGLPGSWGGDHSAPCVSWFDSDRPRFVVGGVQYSVQNYGSASRGRVVIAVT